MNKLLTDIFGSFISDSWREMVEILLNHINKKFSDENMEDQQKSE
jgi:transcription initiation factor IIE alpha subunit